jgi:hypothetical protein
VPDGHTLLRCHRFRSAPGGGIDVDVNRLLRPAASVAALPMRAGGSLVGQSEPLSDALVGAGDLQGGSALFGEHALDLADELQARAATDEAFRGFLSPAPNGAPVGVIKRRRNGDDQQSVEAVQELAKRDSLGGVHGAADASAIAARR